MNNEQHKPTPACNGVHCHVHHVDEANGAHMCFECGHSWPTTQALVDDHNAMARALNGSYGHVVVIPMETGPERIYACPHCAHDF